MHVTTVTCIVVVDIALNMPQSSLHQTFSGLRMVLLLDGNEKLRLEALDKVTCRSRHPSRVTFCASCVETPIALVVVDKSVFLPLSHRSACVTGPLLSTSFQNRKTAVSCCQSSSPNLLLLQPLPC
jgi:hypothetical protein